MVTPVIPNSRLQKNKQDSVLLWTWVNVHQTSLLVLRHTVLWGGSGSSNTQRNKLQLAGIKTGDKTIRSTLTLLFVSVNKSPELLIGLKLNSSHLWLSNICGQLSLISCSVWWSRVMRYQYKHRERSVSITLPLINIISSKRINNGLGLFALSKC